MPRSFCGRTAALVVMASLDILSAGCSRAEDQGWRDKITALRWVDYSPSTGNPDQGKEASVEAIRDDLASLRQAHFSGLVTYSAKGRLGRELISLAKNAGFQGIIIGVWDPMNEDELSAAKSAAASEIVVGFCIGNEGLMTKRYTLEELESAINDVRKATGKPVTTAETIDTYDEKLLHLVDWVFPNAHPYFSNVTEPKAAVAWTQQAFQRLTKETSQFVILKEVGLPTAGDDKEPLSEEAQCEYYVQLAQTNTRFVYFEAFDLLWKLKPPVEPHWGIFRSDRSPKILARHLSENVACRAATTNASVPRSADVKAKPSSGSFYVYFDKDSKLNHFAPTGFMGDVGDINLTEDWRDNPKSGETCIKVEYSAKGKEPTCNYSGPCKWAGVYWQEPAGNSGKASQEEWKKAGYNLQRYKALRFWARADHPSVVEFKVGGVVATYGDSLHPARTVTAHLSSQWTEFTIDLTDADLSYIIDGFAWAASQKLNPSGTTFYLDDIRFESE
jgi:exo-beta-1,3-glucanase (GH17 family)